MIESAIFQGIYKLVLVLIGLIIARAMLYSFDRAIQNAPPTKFMDWYDKASSRDRGIYYAARMVAIFLAVAIAVS